jgi:cytochrome c oxidase subunit III
MTKNIELTKPKQPLSVNKWDFITWLFIVGSIMFFASLTSAYLVRRAEGNWMDFKLPLVLWYSTGLLLVSSIFMHFSYWAAKNDKFTALKWLISITFALGIAFLVLQFYGWKSLVEQKVYFVGNPSGSFMYVFTLIHALHIVSGLVLLAFTFFYALKMNVHKTNLTLIRNCATFWHFLDIVWIYLFMFLLYFR